MTATEIDALKAKVRQAREALEQADAVRNAARMAYYDAVAELQRAQRLTKCSRCGAEFDDAYDHGQCPTCWCETADERNRAFEEEHQVDRARGK